MGLFPCLGPFGEKETCTDPDTSPESLGDFVCECPNHGARATGGPAQCSKQGECSSNLYTSRLRLPQ